MGESRWVPSTQSSQSHGGVIKESPLGCCGLWVFVEPSPPPAFPPFFSGWVPPRASSILWGQETDVPGAPASGGTSLRAHRPQTIGPPTQHLEPRAQRLSRAWVEGLGAPARVPACCPLCCQPRAQCRAGICASGHLEDLTGPP